MKALKTYFELRPFFGYASEKKAAKSVTVYAKPENIELANELEAYLKYDLGMDWSTFGLAEDAQETLSDADIWKYFKFQNRRSEPKLQIHQ